MSQHSNRSSESDESPPAPRVRNPDFRAFCRAVHAAYLDTEEGRMPRDVFLEQKLRLLRAAVRDAQHRGEGDVLVQLMETLRLACAVNDVEVASVRDHFQG